jgi:myo-inositol-1(or 4)-monophosphatase
VIDPLDGTYNFTRKFPFSGISIALLENTTPIIGVVVDIFGRHTFTSAMGIGTIKNGSKITVSKTDRLGNATLTTGFPSGASYEMDHLLNFVKSVQEFKKVRALGAASLMLGLVSEGIFDVYYEKDIYLWDVSAGLSLVKEAGGQYFLRKTIGSFQYEVLASNANVFEEAKALLIRRQN